MEFKDQPENIENASQADFIKDLNFDVDPNDPLTKAALSDAIENEWMDILGNGQLKKKTVVKGQKGTRPERADLCTLNITGKLEDGNEVEVYNEITIQLGDVELVQGLDLAIALMDVGEVAEIEMEARFAYGKLGQSPDIPPEAKLFYQVELKSTQPEPDIDSLGFAQRREIGNKKRERGNWWFIRDEPTTAIQCYRRALTFLSPSNDDATKQPTEKISDTELQMLLEDRTKVYNNLAAAQIKSEAYDAALESIANVLRAEPDNIKALYRKGRILHKKGEYSSAITTLQHAAKFDPESKAIQQELAVLRETNARASLHEKNLYRKMLGTPNQKNNQKSSIDAKKSSSKSKRKFALWSLIGGTIAAVAGVIVYRLTF